MTDRIAFIDCETNGLDPEIHQAWEIALVVRMTDEERSTVDLDKLNLFGQAGWSGYGELTFVAQFPLFEPQNSDPIALGICKFYDRSQFAYPVDREQADWFKMLGAVEVIHRLLADATHLVGNVPSFDANMVGKLFRKFGLTPMWHYHLIDVEALAVGFIAHELLFTQDEAAQTKLRDLITPPYKSRDLSEFIGVKPPDKAHEHEALPDAFWARDIFDVVYGTDMEARKGYVATVISTGPIHPDDPQPQGVVKELIEAEPSGGESWDVDPHLMSGGREDDLPGDATHPE